MNFLQSLKYSFVMLLLISPTYASGEIAMNSINKIIENYVLFLKENKENIDINYVISQPLNTIKALENEIIETEKKLSFAIPLELKNYYLNEANGTEEDIDKYQIFNERLDIFSHQKIIGVDDYFTMYWESMDVDLNIVNKYLSEKEKVFVNKNNKQYFVFAADWSENFIETFVFDKENNFYRFYFDQDVHIIEYINDMIKGSNHMKKSKSFNKLLDDYLDKEMEELKKDFG